MAKTDITGMSYAELSELETRLASLKSEKQDAERAALKQADHHRQGGRIRYS